MIKLFSDNRQDRVALAKSKYFEEGILPSGIVSEQIFQSWMRCYRGNSLPQDKVEFQPVSNSRSQLAIQNNRALVEAWVREQENLLPVIRSSSCSAVLTDPSGVLIGLTPSSQREQKIIPVAHRVGVNLAEEYVGTTAPGLVARTGKQASVSGPEHYYESVKDMYCAAAPIRGVDGKLAGILDISSEVVQFSFDPSVLVGTYASSIENRLLLIQAKDTVIVKFQFLPGLIESPLVGMIGVNHNGQIVWVNTAAHSLLKLPFEIAVNTIRVEEVFDLSTADFFDLTGKDTSIQRLSNGFSVYLQTQYSQPPQYLAIHHSKPALSPSSHSSTLQATSDSHHSNTYSNAKCLSLVTVDTTDQITEPLLEATMGSLRQADAELIKKYLIEYKGNISKVATRLKVSRGLIYRRVQELEIDVSIYKN